MSGVGTRPGDLKVRTRRFNFVAASDSFFDWTFPPQKPFVSWLHPAYTQGVSLLLSIPSFYPILDASTLSEDPATRSLALQSRVQALVEAGVKILQYRNKQGTKAQVVAEARAIRAYAGSAMQLILNDHVSLVEDCEFDGVHLGQGDLPVEQARAMLGAHRILGLSTHNPAQAAEAHALPIDYLAIGPVFPTSSKANAEPVVGLAGVSAARSQTSKPLVAIGGITVENARSVRQAGADSVAVISAVFGHSEGFSALSPPSGRADSESACAGIKKRVAEFLHILQQ